jgi:hypothetical protein
LLSHLCIDAYESVLAGRYSRKAVVPFSFNFFVFRHVDFLELFKFLILHRFPKNNWLEVPHVTWRSIHSVVHVNFWPVVLIIIQLFALVNVEAVVFPWAFALSLHRYIVIVVALLDDPWLYWHILGLNVVKFFVLNAKFARRNLIEKVHIRIF